MPPSGPDGGAISAGGAGVAGGGLLFAEVQIRPVAVVMSWNSILDVLVPIMNVPIALNATVPPVGTLVGTVVLVAAGRGVNVGVFVGAGVLLEVEVGKNVGVGAGPFEIVMDSSAKLGPDEVGALPLLPPQLSMVAPNTNNTTGTITSHLSHRDNIK